MSLKYEIRFTSNCIVYYRHGDYHRIDGASTIRNASGARTWYQYGDYHRENGPAIMFPTGHCLYFLRGNMYTKEEYESKIRSNSHL